MRENDNTDPTIPRFSEMFRFADDSDPNEHLRELRAEAFAYGFNLDLRIHSNGIRPSEQNDVPPVPKRAQEILRELETKHYQRLVEALNAERRARGEKPLGDRVTLAKRQADFEKAYYGKLRHSEKARRIVDLLRAWHGREIVARWLKVEDQFEDRVRVALVAPLVNAARVLDTDFFKLLAQAANMLSRRIYDSKDKTIGTGDTSRDKRILEYAVEIAGTSMHTPHEINVVFDPGFPNLPEEVQHAKDDDLHDRLHELGPVPHRDEPRGRGSPNYGKYVNLPPKRRKKGKY